MNASTTQKQVVSFDPTIQYCQERDSGVPAGRAGLRGGQPSDGGCRRAKDYAAFITYAASDGRLPGPGDGQLPDGYAPIPAAWKAQALGARRAAITAGTPVANRDGRTPTAVGQCLHRGSDGRLDDSGHAAGRLGRHDLRPPRRPLRTLLLTGPRPLR